MAQDVMERQACIQALLGSRPATLLVEHALACLPVWVSNPEWQARRDACELPQGIGGMLGMLCTQWPDEQLSDAEAQWVMALREFTSWRGLSSCVLGDSNQILGMELEQAARRALGLPEEEPE